MPTSFPTFSSGTIITETHLNNIQTAINQLESGLAHYVLTTGSSNAYVADMTPDWLTPYALGNWLWFKANFTNTGAATLNVNTIGAAPIKRMNGSALVAGDIVSGQLYLAVQDGTNFLLINPTLAGPELAVFSIKTTTYTTLATDKIILGNHASTPFTVTLIAATGSGRIQEFVNVGAAAMTLDGNSSETINGATTLVLAQWEGAKLLDYGSGTWVRLVKA